VYYDGPILDLLTLGTLQIELQGMADRVALALLARDGLIDVDKPWLLFRKPQPFIRPRSTGRSATDDVVPVRVMCQRIRSESPLEQDMIFMIPALLADPNARAVLQGIAANILTGIGATGLRGLTSTFRWSSSPLQHSVDLGPEVRRLAMALAKNANGQRARLRIAQTQGNQRLEIELEIEPDER